MVADHVSAMLAYWDENLVCRFANAAYRDWFGMTRDEMVDRITIPELLGNLYPLNEPYILGALAGKVQTFEREIITPSGDKRYSLANYFPDVVDGRVRGFFVHEANVTPMKLLENELLRSNEVISDQNKRLLNFANIVSHNLKSYSNNLEAVLEFYIKANSKEEKDAMFNYLQRISTGLSTTVKHLTQIVEVQNLTDLKQERINVYAYIQRAIDLLQVDIHSSNAVIENEISKDIHLLANPAYMDSILLNLLTNAIKYRKPKRTLHIRISGANVNHQLELRIADNGMGIDLEKNKNNLFGMYKTFHGNTDAKGIGLFITRLHVEAMQGTIDVTSEVDKGTTFILKFPS